MHKVGRKVYPSSKRVYLKGAGSAQQTATTLGRRVEPDIARRRFRVKADFGLVQLTKDAKFDAAHPADLDAFLKNEKELAPFTDELFITEQLFGQLGSAEKSRFRLHKATQAYGQLTTALYRLVRQPTNSARNLLQVEQRPGAITDSEWEYLIKQIRGQTMNVHARNTITVGLIEHIANQRRGRIEPQILAKLTMRGLFNYLRTMHPQQNFHLAVWREFKNEGVVCLKKASVYPTTPPMTPRLVRMDEIRYQVVRAFISCAPVVTQCVTESRISGEWVDFDQGQQDPLRGPHSAVQFPLYRNLNKIGDLIVRECLGVLSVDSDKPDFFLTDEIDLWIEDLGGYLANLVLSEQISRADLRAEEEGPTEVSR